MATLRARSAGRTISATLARTDVRVPLGLLLVAGVLGANVLFWHDARPGRPVLVAAHDVPAGRVLTRDDLAVTHAQLEGALAAMAIPEAELARAVGQMAIRPIAAGDLVESVDLGAGPVLGPGEAAVTVPVDPAAVYPLLARGDVVAVVGTSGRQTPQSQTVTLLPRAVVFDIGAQAIGVGMAPGGGSPDARVLNVTLIVPATELEAVAHAVVDWQVTLVLLPREDPNHAPAQR